MDPIILLVIGVAIVLIAILVFRLHAVIALLLAAITVGLLTPEENLVMFANLKGFSAGETNELIEKSIGVRIAQAFGSTAGKIGVLIAMASIIGSCLLRSGSANRIIRFLLQLFGEKRAAAALLSSGFTLSIPVFFDTVFYLVVPLIKAMTLRTGRNYLLYIIAIVAGAQMAHSLVPPTPGPLLVETEMDSNLYYHPTDPNWLDAQFAKMRAVNKETASLVGEPIFIDPENGNFGFKEGSLAIKLRIEPLDASKMWLIK
ncbi:MAG: hypothetical protein JXQ96_18540 [Cyclobacteriaceae bacterium]